MKLPLRQLSRHLDRGLAPIYLVAADEPLLVAEATDQIRAAAGAAGFEERELHVVTGRGFRWDALEQAADSLSLFAARKIVEIRLPSARPGEAGGRVIRGLAEREDPDRVVILAAGARLDNNAARSVWARTVEQHGAVVEIWPLERAELPGWIARRASQHGVRLTAGAVELLADRVEGNLLAADQEIQKLAIMAGATEVDEAAVLEAVANSARFDVFRLSDALIAGSASRALKVLAGLRAEGVQPTLIAWAIGREVALLARLKFAVASGADLEQAMAELRVWRRRQPAVRRAVGRYAWHELTALIARTAVVDRAVKGRGGVPPWEALTGLVLAVLEPAARRRAA